MTKVNKNNVRKKPLGTGKSYSGKVKADKQQKLNAGKKCSYRSSPCYTISLAVASFVYYN